MIFVCLDSCILNRIVTQSQRGNSIDSFDELTKLAQGGKVQLLLPEVVALEFEKFCRELDDEFTAATNQLKKDIVEACKKKRWNEIDDVTQSLAPHIEGMIVEKKDGFSIRQKAVTEWLRSAAITSVPYDLDIMLRAKRRLMAGRMPPSEKKSDQDASIIESLLKALPKDAELYFASENTRDFAVEVPNKGFVLHPFLSEDFPKTKFFTDLCSLVEAVKTGKTPPAPTDDEVKEAAKGESLAVAVSEALSISDAVEVIVQRATRSEPIMLVKIAGRLVQLGIPANVREQIMADLFRKNLAQAERYLVVKANGWNVFADDATPFKEQSGYFVIDWRTL